MRWAQIATVVAALPLGCYGASVDDEDCVVGTQVTCGCVDGSTGAQVCGADGTFGECACDAPPVGRGGTPAGGAPSAGGRAGAGSGGASTGGAATGGAPGTGGSASGGGGNAGSAGSGGGGIIIGCNPMAGPAQGDAANLVIDLLDDTDTMFSTAGVGMGAWDFSKDASAGMIVPAGTANLMPEVGGFSGSALHVQGSGLTGWGAAIGAFLNGAASSFDASAYAGISFYMKGTTSVAEGADKVMVMARMPDVLPGPGSCCHDTIPGQECYSAHRTVITITSEWTRFSIPWQAFVGPTWGLGSTLAFNPDRIRDITFSFNHDAMLDDGGASFDVWIDELAFEPL